MQTPKFGGVVVPMVTPLTKKLNLDPVATERIIDRLLAADCSPFILGTTGEASLIPVRTKQNMAKLVGSLYAGRSTLYAGIAASSLAETIELGKAFADRGIDVAVAAPPNGYPLGADDQLRFYTILADRLPIPLMLYNIPQTTHISLDLGTLDKLSTHPNIVGIKDSENNATRQSWALNQWKDRDDFVYFAGSAAASSVSLCNGGSGIVPSAGNMIPELYAELYAAAKRNDVEMANHFQTITDEITAMYAGNYPLNKSLPRLKTMLEIMGLCGSTVVPPFEKTDAIARKQLETRMRNNPYLTLELQPA